MPIEDGNGAFYSDDINCSPTACLDAFIARFSESGTLLWSTYYGAPNGVEYIQDISLDLNGNLYAVGQRSASTENFTRPGALNLTTGETMILMFNSDNERVWATAYNLERVEAIAIDRLNRVYICGSTDFPNSPILNADSDYPFNTDYSSWRSGYFLALDINGQPMYSSYYAGNCTAVCTDIDVDQNMNVYIVGVTGQGSCGGATNLPVVDGYSHTANSPDIFIAKIAPYVSGEYNIVKASYFGGSGEDGFEGFISPIATSLDVNSDGSFAIVSQSSSDGNSFPITIQEPSAQPAGYYNQPHASPGPGYPQPDIIIAYFNASFQLAWSTYFGGESVERASAVAINSTRTRMYMVGGSVTNNLAPNLDVEFPTLELNPFSFNDYYQALPVTTFGTLPSWAAMFRLDDILPVSEKFDNISGISIYPNPSTGIFKVANANFSMNENIEILDSYGRIISSFQLNHNALIDLSRLASGVYIVKIKTENRSFQEKIIIQK